MQEFIVHAPIQTRQNSLNKHERLLAFLSAEALNRIAEYQTGQPVPRADLWNTIGVKSEKDWANANAVQPIEYRHYHIQQIEARYHLLEKVYGIPKNGRAIMTDGDEQYQAIVIDQIKRRITSHNFFVSREQFTHCVSCDYVVAPAVARIDRCPVCGRSDLDQLETEGLFTTTTTESRHQIVEQVDIYPEAVRKTLRRTVLTMPDLIQLSKQRKFGTRLTEFGVDERFVLDPKIPLALMGHVVNEMGIGQIKAFVQGVDSVGNLAPYVYLTDPDGHYAFVSTGLVPPFNEGILNDRNKPFYTSFLPLAMMSTPGGIDVGQRLNLFKEFDRTTRQFQFALSALEQLSKDPSLTTDSGLYFPLQEIYTLINKYQPREAIIALRQFLYDSISRDYIIHCREKGIRPDSQIIKQVKEIASLIYHQ